MALTTPQLQALKAHILADPALNAQPNTPDGAFDIALAMNLNAAPNYFVWSTFVTQDAIMQNGFDWVRVDNLSVGKARIWEWLFDNPSRSIDPSKVNVRSGIAEVWKGTAADNAVRFAVFGHCQRLATRAEKLYVTSGAGTTTNEDGVGPATMGFTGSINFNDVLQARALP